MINITKLISMINGLSQAKRERGGGIEGERATEREREKERERKRERDRRGEREKENQRERERGERERERERYRKRDTFVGISRFVHFFISMINGLSHSHLMLAECGCLFAEFCA
jgi:hypothetical protein